MVEGIETGTCKIYFDWFDYIRSGEKGRTDACAEGLFCKAVPMIHRTWVLMEGVEEGAVKRF